jgi:hypothetical protein
MLRLLQLFFKAASPFKNIAPFGGDVFMALFTNSLREQEKTPQL